MPKPSGKARSAIVHKIARSDRKWSSSDYAALSSQMQNGMCFELETVKGSEMVSLIDLSVESIKWRF